MLIIGITGTLGAGKGTIVNYLVEKKDFKHFSARGFITEEIIRRGLSVNRDNLVLIANELRAKYSPSYIAEQLFEEAKKSGKSTIIESLRTPGEVEALQKRGDFYLFAVDANSKIRYDRITYRKSETDNVSYEKFIDDEKKEMSSTDPNKQNLSKCISMADYVFNNNGTIEELEKEVERVLGEIKNE